MIRKQEHINHCKSIARELEAYANGQVYICPECGAHVHEGCECCGATVEVDTWDAAGLLDYFEDVLDVEYRIGADKSFRSVRLMVAFGGPNIYIDTEAREVQLRWWTEAGEYCLDSDICDEINDLFEELYKV